MNPESLYGQPPEFEKFFRAGREAGRAVDLESISSRLRQLVESTEDLRSKIVSTKERVLQLKGDKADSERIEYRERLLGDYEDQTNSNKKEIKRLEQLANFLIGEELN